MNLANIITIINHIAALAVFAFALFCLAQRPRDYFRLAARAFKALIPAWAIVLAAVLAAILLFPADKGLAVFLGLWAFPCAVQLLMAQFCLCAGSIWVWRGGLRGRGFGWLGAWRRLGTLVPWRPFLGGAVLANVFIIVKLT